MSPRAFVIGWPISHSRSPLIHTYWLRQLGVAGSYERVPVAPPDLPAFLANLDDRASPGAMSRCRIRRRPSPPAPSLLQWRSASRL